ncbi:MAG: hypothetical protein R2747_05300 [Pyrinomonadaceae bacterium]
MREGRWVGMVAEILEMMANPKNLRVDPETGVEHFDGGTFIPITGPSRYEFSNGARAFTNNFTEVVITFPDGERVSVDWETAEPSIWALQQGNFARPEIWHCIFCGWKSPEKIDPEICRSCQKPRPSPTLSGKMKPCEECRQWTIETAVCCEWCGGKFKEANKDL